MASIAMLLYWRVLLKMPRFVGPKRCHPRIVFFREIVDFMQRDSAAAEVDGLEMGPQLLVFPKALLLVDIYIYIL